MKDFVKNNPKKAGCLVAAIVLLIVLLDQALKVYVKLNFRLGEAIEIFPWFQICFVENNGMAFGIQWFDKLFLTLFRIVAVGALSWYMHTLIRKGTHVVYLSMIALVTAGALGNIFDCLIYGQIFSASSPVEVAGLVPWGQGYADIFYGKVVDMFYFPLIHGADGEVLFFQPVFNLADSAITVSVAILLILMLFRKDIVSELIEEKKDDSSKDNQGE